MRLRHSLQLPILINKSSLFKQVICYFPSNINKRHIGIFDLSALSFQLKNFRSVLCWRGIDMYSNDICICLCKLYDFPRIGQIRDDLEVMILKVEKPFGLLEGSA